MNKNKLNLRRAHILSLRIFPQHKVILQDPTSLSSKDKGYRNTEQDRKKIPASLANTIK
jgi:hypothetical protein